MDRYERAVQINASPAVVWSVMTDIESWPEWTLSIAAAGPAAIPMSWLGARMSRRNVDLEAEA